MKTLETERLILRPWKLADLDDFYEYAKVEGVGEMAGWPHHTDKNITLRILKSFIRNDNVYALVLKENGKVIGSLGLHNNTFDRSRKESEQRELGYTLSRDYWGKGLMPEAVNAAVKYAFEEMNIDILWCGHFEINKRSRRVIEKSGFRFYRKGRYFANQLDRTFDDMKYIMTRADYEETNNDNSL